MPGNDFRTLQQLVDKAVSPRRFVVLLLGGFALFALILASLGIYGVISFTVARRTPEMGIRIALGASRRELMIMILRQGMIPVVTGLLAGLLGAISIGRVLSSELYGTATRDPAIMAAVAVVLLAVAVMVMIQIVARSWTRSWVGAGGRAIEGLPLSHSEHALHNEVLDDVAAEVAV